MANVDPYSLLGVSRTASQEEIKSAYRKKALENHPDRNEGDSHAEARFKEISAAYTMIGDPSARREYDESSRPVRPNHPHRGFSDIFRGSGFDFSNQASWDDLFGSAVQRKPFSIRARVDVTLLDLTRISEKRFVLDGKSVEFRLPAGVRHDMTITVPLKSNQELHAKINVLQDDRFKVTGDDLHSVIDVPVAIAARGGEILADTLEGKIKLKVSEFTSSHKKMRVRQRGLMKPDGTRGSLIYEVRLVFDAGSRDKEDYLNDYFG